MKPKSKRMVRKPCTRYLRNTEIAMTPGRVWVGDFCFDLDDARKLQIFLTKAIAYLEYLKQKDEG